MKKLMCIVTVLMMISMFAFSINSFSADEVNNNETTLVTNQDDTENEDFNDEDFVDMDGHDDDLADEYYMEHGDEDDEDNNSAVVPFQVAYAVSIHKAQGLEYDSVKIVITNETEERITHNIFYTAITRAKNKLKVYWSPETEQSVLERLEVKSSQKDAHLLSQLSSLTMEN